MVLGQRPIKMLQTKNKMGKSLSLGGLTACRTAQSDGAVHVKVEGNVRVIVDSVWIELWRALCDNSNNLIENHKKTTINQIKMAQNKKQRQYLRGFNVPPWIRMEI